MTDLSPLKDTMSHAKLLKNALRIIKRRSNGDPTWGAVADICQVGSHHATQICCEIGVDPYAGKFKEVPPGPQGC